MRFSIWFQRHGKRPEISNGHTTAKFWEYESRIAKRWNVDPRPVTSISPYAVMQNNPIANTDVLGDTTGNPNDIFDEPIIDMDYFDDQTKLALDRPFEALSMLTIANFAKNASENLSLDDVYTQRKGIKDGPLTNTFRHAFGQAIATVNFDEKIAKDWGDAHEGNFSNILGKVDAIDFEGNNTGLEVMAAIERDGYALVNGYNVADAYVDLNNNAWGRFVGSMAKTIDKTSYIDVQKMVIDEMMKGRLLVRYPNQSNMPQEFREKLPEGFAFDGNIMFIAPVKINTNQAKEINGKLFKNNN